MQFLNIIFYEFIAPGPQDIFVGNEMQKHNFNMSAFATPSATLIFFMTANLVYLLFLRLDCLHCVSQIVLKKFSVDAEFRKPTMLFGNHIALMRILAWMGRHWKLDVLLASYLLLVFVLVY